VSKIIDTIDVIFDHDCAWSERHLLEHQSLAMMFVMHCTDGNIIVLTPTKETGGRTFVYSALSVIALATDVYALSNMSEAWALAGEAARASVEHGIAPSQSEQRLEILSVFTFMRANDQQEDHPGRYEIHHRVSARGIERDWSTGKVTGLTPTLPELTAAIRKGGSPGGPITGIVPPWPVPVELQRSARRVMADLGTLCEWVREAVVYKTADDRPETAS
jgi:hypothetical protein